MSEPDRAAAGSGAGAGLPRWAPSPREYDDLALALDGILAEVTVAVPAGVVPDGNVTAELTAAELTDLEGTPVARLDVTVAAETAPGAWSLTGTVAPLRPREDGVFRHLHRSPAQVRELLGSVDRSGGRAAAVVLDAPLDQAALDRLADAVAGYDETVLLPLVGAGSPRGVSAHTLVRATLAAADLLPGQPLVVPVPLAARTDAAADVALRDLVARAYGDPVRLAVEPTSGGGDGGYPAPIAAALGSSSRGTPQRGLVVFFTGLSGSGKSTLARRLHDLVLERGDRRVTQLDGDVVRRMLSAGLGFSRADREANIARIGFVAAEVARHGGLAICAPIAPYAATRAEVRRMVEAADGTFVLIHVSTPLAECERRDRKGLYAKARAGLIPEFTGISDPYEPPDDADLAIDTSDVTIDDAAAKVLGLLDERGLLSSPPPTP
ncbi:sulfate adenylyltransferase [Actinopolymorpha cephalotaxi]|uniref:Adenylyl-sulfate kinase n=1 Tax=Actinopolymorpha cephalotaxi TaxID=504797 RepID=A0A1I2Y2M1_9ACTN|nr:adenylyl-sulfate kinase [Actinopolymorpha cephalotaxi]NYH87289.1 sulfate adenylyltransferase [Actinopolymorpha cephalotaxi]SFH19597.1 sulfate adenylyltransferase [Actinopolymorpha cephalotaxi]